MSRTSAFTSEFKYQKSNHTNLGVRKMGGGGGGGSMGGGGGSIKGGG